MKPEPNITCDKTYTIKPCQSDFEELYNFMNDNIQNAEKKYYRVILLYNYMNSVR